jgi:ligand-binding sensor domain-containing protein/signal transduction histidine kinase
VPASVSDLASSFLQTGIIYLSTAPVPNILGRIDERGEIASLRSLGPSHKFVLGFFLVSTVAQAERLPIKAYTTADGLPHNTVMRIVRDSQGFLWFCTLGGLARYDGYTFINYGVEQGLRGSVTDFLETRKGDYWVATLGGLYRFNPHPSGANSKERKVDRNALTAARPMFELYRVSDDEGAQGVNTLHEDRQGTIWAATNGGLYRFTQADNRWTSALVDLASGKRGNKIRALELHEDREGTMWVSLPLNGLRRLWPDGRIERYTTLGFPAKPSNESSDEGIVSAMLEDHEGRLWLGTTRGLALLVRRPDSDRPQAVRVYTTKDGLHDNTVAGLLESAERKLWVGTETGLSEFCPASTCGRERLRSYTVALPPTRSGVWTLTEDRDGNVWMGYDVGAFRMAQDGFTTYDEADGLGSSRVLSVSEDAAGELCVVTEGPHRGYINRFDGSRFKATSPRLLKPVTPRVPVTRQNDLQDHTGEWWVTTDQGLFRYPKVRRVEELAQTLPKSVFNTTRNALLSPAISGLKGTVRDIDSLYGDSHGDLWIGYFSSSTITGGLARWQRSTQTFHVYSKAEGLTASTNPIAFCEDRSGNVWVGFHGHDLARYHDGHFTVFTAADGLPAGSIWSIFMDHEGRLWAATTQGGLVRIDDSQGDRPRFVAYTTAEGLSSNQVQAITEDQWGRIYALTDKGVDRLDPKTGGVKRYTSADGLVGSSHWGVAFRDRHGALWFGTLQGLSRLVPKPDEPASPPPVRIAAIRVRGEPYPISELGESRLARLVLAPNENQVQIEFASLNFSVGDVLRYKYKLEGADRDWSKITEQRTVNYATLSPGAYRFLVRAINWEGRMSPNVAEVDFQILPPVWGRWWFESLLAVLITSTVYAFYRYRVERLLELERVRARIAADLHDDIGSSLSGMAFLSEAVKQQIGGTYPEAFAMAGEVAAMARGLADALSDVVWSIDPRRDDLASLLTRVRQSVSHLLEPQGIAWQLQAPPEPEKVKLAPEQRRHLFLILKEAVNNSARHARCTSVNLTVSLADHRLEIGIEDNGCGFSAGYSSDRNEHDRPGHGLNNMRLRAAQLGGQMNIDSAPGRGTKLRVTVPLR